MGALYDLKVKIEATIKTGKLDEAAVKGKIGLKSGKVLAFIKADTPDDPAVVAKLKAAAEEVLQVSL